MVACLLEVGFFVPQVEQEVQQSYKVSSDKSRGMDSLTKSYDRVAT
jgi:hypothetical protein